MSNVSQESSTRPEDQYGEEPKSERDDTMSTGTDAFDPLDGANPSREDAKISVRDLDVYYGEDQALQSVDIDIPEKSVTAFIGPSGCGKSTFLRCLNRMNDEIDVARVEGSIEFDGVEINEQDVDLVELRRRIGMVFQQPNPFPKSIRSNITYAPSKHGDVRTGILDRLLGRANHEEAEELVRRSLESAALWDEVNDPASALDPIATSQIEDLIEELAEEYTVVIVTHNMQQAARISDQTAVFLTGGELVEYGDTERIFENPENDRVEDYITGKFG